MKLLIWRPIDRILNNPSLVALIFFGVTLWLGFYFVGQWLLPVIISLVLAYLLEGLICKLEKWGMRRLFAVLLVFFSFFGLIFYTLVALVPTLLTQAKALVENLPEYLNYAQSHLYVLPERFPQHVSQADIDTLMQSVNQMIADMSRYLFSVQIFASLMLAISILIYLILVPILIFFFLKDKKIILEWLGRFMPSNREIIKEIWAEVDVQIGNYIRGKFIEILIIWAACFLAFNLFGMQYSLLISLMVGLSVLIPYIGAAVVTLPVLVVAYMQFGFVSDFWWIMGIYFVIQIFDGNVLVPLVFSEAVNIHPVAIISAILIFGGLWGFWGVFFAIPLATLVKAVIEAWRRYEIREETEDIQFMQDAT